MHNGFLHPQGKGVATEAYASNLWYEPCRLLDREHYERHPEMLRACSLHIAAVCHFRRQYQRSMGDHFAVPVGNRSILLHDFLFLHE